MARSRFVLVVLALSVVIGIVLLVVMENGASTTIVPASSDVSVNDPHAERGMLESTLETLDADSGVSERTPTASDPPGNVSVFGALRTSSGAPARVHEVRALTWNGAQAILGSHDTGSYRITGLSAGKWMIRTESPPEGTLTQFIQLDADETEHRLDFTFPETTPLALYLDVDDLNAVERALNATPRSSPRDALDVVAIPMAPDRCVCGIDGPTFGSPLSIRMIALAANGSSQRLARLFYDFRSGSETAPPNDGLPASDLVGNFDVELPPPFYVALTWRGMLVDSALIAGNESEVVLRVRAADLRHATIRASLRVLDGESGAPIADAYVGLVDTNGLDPHSSSTGESGDAIVEGSVTCHARLTLIKAGYESYARIVSLPREGNVDLGEVWLHHATRVRGRVLTKAGRALSASVGVLDLDGGSAEHTLSVYSDSGTGEFAFERLGRRRYVLLVHDADATSRPVLVDAREGDVDDVELRAEKSSTLTLDVDRTWPWDAQVIVSDDRGVPVSRPAFAGITQHTLPLARGAWRVEIVLDGRTLASQAFEVDRASTYVWLGR